MTETERISDVMEKLRKTSFMRMPASTKYHNNHEGGLFQHSVGVALNLRFLTEQLELKWERPSSPEVIGLLHDACKIDMYFYNHDYKCWEHNPDHPAGHADLSLKVIEELGIELTDEEKACIRWHMGAFDDQENWGKFTNAIHQYPNVLYTHVADMKATHIDEIEEHGRACCICGKPFEENQFGNNPAPVLNYGECCDDCNMNIVIPARLSSGGNDNEE